MMLDIKERMFFVVSVFFGYILQDQLPLDPGLSANVFEREAICNAR